MTGKSPRPSVNLNKWCALITALALVLSGCGQSFTPETSSDDAVLSQSEAASHGASTQAAPSKKQDDVLRLVYSSADTLNPYTAATLYNRQLLPLFYDGLVETDQRFEPQMRLAKSVTVNGDICTVRWRQDVRFSDGTGISGQDILYSLNLAKNSDTLWKTTLSNYESGKLSEDGGSVELKLYRPDANFAAMLTCPIVKDGTGTQEFPTAIGKFYVDGAHNTGLILRPSPLYYEKPGDIREIRLIHTSDAEALRFQLKSGDVDMGYLGTRDSSVSGLSVGLRSVPTSRMMYLGFNGNRPLLGRAEFRHAMALTVGRDVMISDAFGKKADGAPYPFHPAYYRFGDVRPAVQPNISRAQTLLRELTLPGEDAPLRLLVNTENSARLSVANILSQQLRSVGIYVTPDTCSFQEYQARLAAGNYDLYLGEVLMNESFDSTPLLKGGALGYQTPAVPELAQAYDAYRSTGEGLLNVCDMFLNYSPLIPLVFLKNDVYVSYSLSANSVSTQNNVFYNILQW